MKHKTTGLAPDTADRMLRYEWPGNVRELENGLGRAVALARGNAKQLQIGWATLYRKLKRYGLIGKKRPH